MDKIALQTLLEAVASGKTNVDEAARSLTHLHVEDIEYAHIDHHRSLRKGFPDADYHPDARMILLKNQEIPLRGNGSPCEFKKEASILKHFLFFIFLSLAGIPGKGLAEERRMPFSPGERLTFELKWGVIPAGEAVLEVLPVEMINGAPAYHFVLTATSNSVLDVFYKVRDRIDSYTDIHMTHSVLYKKIQNEGNTHRDIVVQFDWDKSEANYTNFNRPKPPVKLLPGSFDPLAIFYHARRLDLKINSFFEHPVSDGRKSIMGQAKITNRETLTINGKTYDTVLIEPELKDIGGVFQKSKDGKIEIWLTADEHRIPVKIRSKVVVGSFVGELTSQFLNAHR
ncbi:MAG: DUF3108 domain-containing protein [Pseudomonadota bacterium]